jgi:hypothetical protein
VSLFDGRISSKVIAEAIEVVELVKEKKEEGKKRKLSKEQEIMLHVAPFLPHSSEQEDGNQQLHKKRHLGNDICVVIYKVFGCWLLVLMGRRIFVLFCF